MSSPESAPPYYPGQLQDQPMVGFLQSDDDARALKKARKPKSVDEKVEKKLKASHFLLFSRHFLRPA